jgi:hypothetical protein
MNLYAYTAILSKTMLAKGKVTYTDTRQRTGDCVIGVPLDSECVTGHVLAEHANQAKAYATESLKRDFPIERHYSNHENVTVRPVEEVIYV